MHLVNRKYHNCQIFNAHGTVESEANHNKFLSVLSLTAFPRKCSNCFIFLWWRLLPHYRSVAWVNFYWSSSYSVQGRAQWEKCDNFYTCEWPRSEGLCAYVVCDFSSFLRFFRLYKLINLQERWQFNYKKSVFYERYLQFMTQKQQNYLKRLNNCRSEVGHQQFLTRNFSKYNWHRCLTYY